MAEQQFDVFLAHSSQDKTLIRQLYQQLRERGLGPWLDEEEIPPGSSFQNEIEKVIGQIKAAAICLGEGGLGRWQVIELRAFISQCVRRNIPIIPVLLPGVKEIPENLLFLQEFHAVVFNQDVFDDQALDRLEWGITGQKPSKKPVEPSRTDSSSPKVSEGIHQPTVQNQVAPSVSPTEASSELQQFSFKVVALDVQGKEKTRTNHSAQYFTEHVASGVDLEMVSIPGGSFQMGSPNDEGDDDEHPQHLVQVPSFYFGKYPVTQAQWRAVAALERVNRNLEPDPSEFNGDQRPVERVSWEEAVEFCDRLSLKTGKTYRLPSEAEWEYACRAGTTTLCHFGQAISSDFVNYGYIFEQTADVGHFGVANDFGLYDMHGNVWEWCLDTYQNSYKSAPANGSAWIVENENDVRRLLRGGSWLFGPGYCRSARRNYNAPGSRSNTVGFRVLCVRS